jgi:hypothetical protein
MPHATDLAAPPELQNRNHTERRPVTSRGILRGTGASMGHNDTQASWSPAGFAHRMSEQRARGNP